MSGFKKDRIDEFSRVKSGSFSGLSTPLFISAFSLLELAYRDRPGLPGTEENHFSWHVPGSINLLVDAFEVWINERIQHSAYFDGDTKRQMAKLPLRERFYVSPSRLGGCPIERNTDLELVIELRHEITHYLPWVPALGEFVPPWFSGLQEKGLFMSISDSKWDYSFDQKLCSFYLCYWAWETVARAGQNYINAFKDKPSAAEHTLRNIRLYEAIPRPIGLPPDTDLSH